MASMASKLVHVVVFTPKEGEEKGTAKFVDGLRGLSGMGSNKFLLAGSGMSIDSREKGEDGHYKRRYVDERCMNSNSLFLVDALAFVLSAYSFNWCSSSL